MSLFSEWWTNLRGSRRRKWAQERSGQGLEHWDRLAAAHEVVETSGDGTRAEPQQPVWKPHDPNFWKEHLHANEYRILFRHGTEFAGSSAYDKFYPDQGHFACRACGLPLYAARAKFDSHTGWPSFGCHILGNLHTKTDYSLGKRAELQCRRCRGHLGHVFVDQYPVRQDAQGRYFKERQCINGLALYYVDQPLDKAINDKATVSQHPDRIFKDGKELKLYE
jgi:peptide-methionine (R)-S-oxide reductase